MSLLGYLIITTNASTFSVLSDHRWPMASDTVQFPDRGPKLTAHCGGLQLAQHKIWLTLPP